MSDEDYQYDVALSFAGEDRSYVEDVAREAELLGVRVFYDKYEAAGLWGKDLYDHLDWVYRKAARYCVLFASQPYAKKVWTTHERRSAQARALEARAEYVLPARFDDTEIPGLRPTVGYVDLRTTSPKELAGLIREKVGEAVRRNFLPPQLDQLYECLGLEDEQERTVIDQQAHFLFRTFTRLTPRERTVLGTVLVHGCPASLPDDVHVNADLLSRCLGTSIPEILDVLGGMESLGIFARVYEGNDDHDDDGIGGLSTMVAVEFDLMTDPPLGGNVTELAVAMGMGVGRLCEDHALEAFVNLDFAHLSVATEREHGHPSSS